MDFSDWLTPDGVAEKLLAGVFGPTAAIVAIFAAANFVMSWLGFARSGVRFARTSATAVSSAYRTVVRMPPAAAAVSTVVTVLLVLLQLVWLWSASRIANGLSYLWNAPFGTGSPELSGLVSYVHWDWISTLYFVASIVALIASYSGAFGVVKPEFGERVTWLLLAPLWLPWGLFALLGSLLALLLAGMRTLSDESPKLAHDGQVILVVMAIVLSYSLAVHLAVGSTRTVVRLWRPAVPGRPS